MLVTAASVAGASGAGNGIDDLALLCISGNTVPELDSGPGPPLPICAPDFCIFPLLVEAESTLTVMAGLVLAGEETPLCSSADLILTDPTPTGCSDLLPPDAGVVVCLTFLKGTSLRSLSALRFKVPFVVEVLVGGRTEDTSGLTVGF